MTEKNEELSRMPALLMQSLDWLYDKVVPEALKLDGPVQLSNDAEIDRWVGIASLQAGATGFVSNLGGLITLPFALPANIAGTYAIQLRLIAKIAASRGYDPRQSDVKMVAFVCLTGSAASKILKDAGVQLSIKLGQSAISQIAGASLIRINQAVGFRLITKAGSHGIVNLGKIIPFLGGFVGGGFDIVTTRLVAKAAKKMFPVRTAIPNAITAEAVLIDQNNSKSEEIL